jgi:EAL domain-containing protein (putative c-di-GMP-specific phosphodiesterase class I)
MLHYQPQVDVNAGALVGFEALVRWQHPEMGMISPGRFIPLAEETGLIVPMTEWILHEACRQIKEWQDAGLPRARVAVNLSARQFQQKSVVPTVDRALRSTGLDAKWLEVELTECSAILDPDYTVMTIRALQEMGVEVAMDDFGTGYSSLGYLKRLPFDTIKIDQSFVREIANDPGSAAIVTTIITMAQNLGRRVLAEGVETEDQLIFLRMQGCHLIQGYLISRPLAASDLRSMLTIKPSHEVRRYAHFENAPEGLIQTIARYSYPLPPAPSVMQ